MCKMLQEIKYCKIQKIAPEPREVGDLAWGPFFGRNVQVPCRWGELGGSRWVWCRLISWPEHLAVPVWCGGEISIRSWVGIGSRHGWTGLTTAPCVLLVTKTGECSWSSLFSWKHFSFPIHMLPWDVGSSPAFLTCALPLWSAKGWSCS